MTLASFRSRGRPPVSNNPCLLPFPCSTPSNDTNSIPPAGSRCNWSKVDTAYDTLALASNAQKWVPRRVSPNLTPIWSGGLVGRAISHTPHSEDFENSSSSVKSSFVWLTGSVVFHATMRRYDLYTAHLTELTRVFACSCLLTRIPYRLASRSGVG